MSPPWMPKRISSSLNRSGCVPNRDHAVATHSSPNSARARTILENWAEYLPKFKKVMPVEYRQALMEMAKQQAADPNGLEVIEIGLRADKG